MTPSAAFRLWVKQSRPAERAMTAVALSMVVGLVAWGLVPAPVERRTFEAAGLAPTGQASIAEAGEGNDVVGTSPPNASAAPGSGGFPTPATITGRGPSGRGDPQKPALAKERSTDGGAAPAPTRPLTASDRGVTADSIKVGFTVIDFAGANDLGISPNLRGDASRVIDALVEYANKRGGVLGRRIQPVKVKADLAKPDEQRQKCLELTETHGVFAVVDSFAFSAETSTACITAEQKTLLVNGIPGSSENVRRGFPYHVSVKKDDNRKMKDLVAAAKTSGFFDPARGFRKLGIFGDTCGVSSGIFDSSTDGLKAYLAAAGIKDWSEFRISCDNAGAHRGGAQAVVQFKNDGVSHVLLAAHPPVAEAYLNAAGNARYYPEYFAGDYLNLAVGGLTDRYEPEGFDGAMGVTQTHAGEGAIGKPLPPLTQTCSKIFSDHGLAPVSAAPPRDIGDDLEVLELCENFLLFLQVATAAGQDLTRASWVRALAGIGDFRAATTDLARFDRPGKMTGGDTTKLIMWHRSCSCWKELTEFAPAAG